MRKILCLLFAVGTVASPAVGAESFPETCARLAAAAQRENRLAVAGRDGWLFLASELRHIGVGPFWGEFAAAASRAPRPEQADPLPVIVDFQKQLAQLGIELILVPVPPKALIYPDKLVETASPAATAETELARFYDLLRAQDVAVLDLAPRFLAERAAGEPAPLYCRQDSHWSGRACIVAAKAIAAAIADRPWLAASERKEVELTEAEIELQGDLWASLPEPRPERERIPVRRVQADQQPVAPDRASPVLLLGDSHVLAFHAGGDMQTAGAGLADQLAAELGFPVDVLGVRGSGATPARISLMRRARAESGYLADKKLVVWCFGAREFTEATGWSPVPFSVP